MHLDRLEPLRPRLQSYVDEGKIHGIDAFLLHRGKTMFRHTVGWRDKEAAIPLGEDAIFRIYSMTKPVICTALMVLHEQGKFQLTDPVSKYLPSFRSPRVLENRPDGAHRLVPAKREITVGDLFTHTSGLTYDFLEESPVGELYREAGLNHRADRTLAEMVCALAEFPLAYHPGERWHYSLSTDVLAHLIEVLSNLPLATTLAENLFSPLGMTDTGYHVPEARRHRVATVYGVGDFCDPALTHPRFRELWKTEKMRPLDVSQTYPPDRPGLWARGGIGLFSTTEDYARFSLMLQNRGALDGARILHPETVDMMHSNHLPKELLPYHVSGLSFYHGYGFGLGSRVLLDVAASQMPGSVGEFGWYGAARTYYWVDPRAEMIGIVMAQCILGPDKPEKDLQAFAYAALQASTGADAPTQAIAEKSPAGKMLL